MPAVSETLPVTRKAAKLVGAQRFNTGKLCKRGHTADRYTSSGACSECAKLLARAWDACNPELSRSQKLARQRRRNGRIRGYPEPTRPIPDGCECCGKPRAVTLALDHDHETGGFRGWLCRKCNTALGLLGDSKEGILRLLRYITLSEDSLS